MPGEREVGSDVVAGERIDVLTRDVLRQVIAAGLVEYFANRSGGIPGLYVYVGSPAGAQVLAKVAARAVWHHLVRILGGDTWTEGASMFPPSPPGSRFEGLPEL